MTTFEQYPDTLEHFAGPETVTGPFDGIAVESVNDLVSLQAFADRLQPIPVTDGGAMRIAYKSPDSGEVYSTREFNMLRAKADPESHILSADEFEGHQEVSYGDFMSDDESEDDEFALIVQQARRDVRELVDAGVSRSEAVWQVADRSRQKLNLSDYAADPVEYDRRAGILPATEATVVTSEPVTLTPEDESVGVHEVKAITTSDLREINDAIKRQTPTIDEYDTLRDMNQDVGFKPDGTRYDMETGTEIDSDVAGEFDRLTDEATWLLSEDAAATERRIAKLDALTPMEDVYNAVGSVGEVAELVARTGKNNAETIVMLAEDAKRRLQLDAALRARGINEAVIQELDEEADAYRIGMQARQEVVAIEDELDEVGYEPAYDHAQEPIFARADETHDDEFDDDDNPPVKPTANAPLNPPVRIVSRKADTLVQPVVAEAEEKQNAFRRLLGKVAIGRQAINTRAMMTMSNLMARNGAAVAVADQLLGTAGTDGLEQNEERNRKGIRYAAAAVGGFALSVAAAYTSHKYGLDTRLGISAWPFSGGGLTAQGGEIAANVPAPAGTSQAVQPPAGTGSTTPPAEVTASPARQQVSLEAYDSQTGAGTVEGSALQQARELNLGNDLTPTQYQDFTNELRTATLKINGLTEAQAEQLHVHHMLDLLSRQEIEEILKSVKTSK